MYRAGISCAVVALVLLAGWTSRADGQEQREQLSPAATDIQRERHRRLGLAALDRFLETFNTRNASVWAKSLHFPHVRPSAGNFALNDTVRDWLPRRSGMFERLVSTGWHRTQWDSRRIVHASPEKLHIAARHTRRSKNGEELSSNQVVYVVTSKANKWGVQARFGTGRFEVGQQLDKDAESALMAVQAYLEAFNTFDAEAWADTLHFPHVRLSGSGLDFWRTREDFLSGTEPGRQLTWFRTRLDHSTVLQIGPEGANVAVRLSHLNAEGDNLCTYDAIYLVTSREGRWAVQSRSTYAP